MSFSLYRRPALERSKIMRFSSWLRNRQRPAAAARRRTRTSPRPQAGFRPHLESLEDRTVPSGFQQTNLVGYVPGTAHFTDPNLNGWGMVGMPDGSFCVANPFNTGLATFYDRSGHVLPLTITVPASTAQPFGPVGEPTGVVYNATSDFMITANGKRAPARLIFDSIDGTISGWNPDVDPTHAIVMVDNFAHGHTVVYTGLEMAQNSQRQNVLYATDIINNRVEMLVGSFNATPSYFTDPTATSVDAGFGAWSVQAVNGELYVTFGNPFSPVSGPHGGVVDVFDTDGNLLTPNHFAANAPGAGPLENPWGITQAPANFGAYSNDLLIGNVAGHGNINVYNPATGAYLGQLKHPDGTRVAIKGLWDLEFGDGTPQSGKTNQLFFDAGPNAPEVIGYGLFGVIRAAGDQGGNGGGHPGREAAAPSQPVQQMLTPAHLQPVVQQALADWQSAGATTAHSAQLRQVPVSIQALPASYLGEGAGNQVWTSPNAAGWGWGLGASTPTGRTDLGSVPDDEFGHMLGLEDTDNLPDVIGETPAGVHRLPRASDLGGSGLSNASVGLAPTADPPWTW
jgi:uncharacterized protein (TIGR03118 family)